MLEVINGFANGWVASHVIGAFVRHDVFEEMALQPMTLKELVARYRGNAGHLHAALRLLYELGWVESVEPDRYGAVSGAGLARQLPSDLLEGVQLPLAQALATEQSEPSERLLRWLDRCGAGWVGVEPAVASVLDGILLTPLLAQLYALGGGVLERTQPSGISAPALRAVRALFVQRGWGQVKASVFRLAPSGRALLASSGALGTVVSYVPMFSQMDDLLFGETQVIFGADEQGHELHVDRTMNVTASGVQHQSHFAELDTLILRIFDQSPLEMQPRYVADMGCGDGSLLQRIYELVRTRSARGQALAEYPLTLIGADYNSLSLEATGKTLAGLPHLLVRGDIADPQQLMVDLAAAGVPDPENILHVRSFLDHDRPFLPVEDKSAARRRKGLNYTGVYVARDGSEIKPTHAVQGLVEHLRRWRTAVSRFGLLLLEVHCLRPATVKRLGNMTESAHYDAFHAFSGQQLVEAPVFLVAAAEAGFFPEPGMSQTIPKMLDFTRISLHRLIPQSYIGRHPVPADLPRLKQLDRMCQPSALRTPAAEIERRVGSFAQGQMVLEFDGQIVAALYTQRIDSLEALRNTCYAELARLHRPEGRYVQLLGLFVVPEMQGRGFSDALIDLMLTYAATLDGVDAVVGVTRCANFVQHKAVCSYDDYIQLRDELGQLKDPMLHFHASHGAAMREVLPEFRPEDTDNEGAGILIEYKLRSGAAVVAEANAPQAVSERFTLAEGQIEPAVRSTVMQVLGSQRATAYDPQAPLMEMGLSSLELLELRLLLSARMGESLTATFLFSYGTPEGIIEYFMTRATVQPMLQTTEAPTPDVIIAPARAMQASSSHDPGRESTRSDKAIAIIGVACRLPGGVNNPVQFWQGLIEARDAVGPLPANRQLLWGSRAQPCRWQGGFLAEVDCFDTAFFRISPREAELLDPQQRLLLEVAWEAVESAAIAPAMLRGTRSGVFVGMMGRDYEDVIACQGSEADLGAQFATGNACSVAAGRLSYFFDWRGPALSIDTACSSSLVAVHTACRSLLGGECNLALAAGVNLLLDDKRFLAYEQAGMLSPHGRCRTFDASADGYVRGEGCAAVILKRLSDAQADGDPILAVIQGSAINQDGSSSGLTAPNQLAQQAVIEAALAEAGLAPHEITYLEAHGTGTKLGDPIEVMAAAHALGVGRPDDRPLLIGSLKSAIGHLEAAAGIAGLIKTMLSMQQGMIPAQLHFATPNPHIPWESLPVRVVAQAQAWPTGLKRAGISSFGFSGTNAHVIIEEYLGPQRESTAVHGLVMIVLSAKSEEQMRDQAQRLLAYLEQQSEVNLTDLAYTLQVGRESLGVRLALVVNTVEALKEQLLGYVRGEAICKDTYQAEPKRSQQTLAAALGADEDLQKTIGAWVAKGKLSNLAQLWVQGLEMKWGQLYGEPKPQRINLPTYPFAKERYWVPMTSVPGRAEHQLHPLVHRNTSDLSEERFSTTLTGKEFFLRDHVVLGERVVPGAAQLEWARAAVVLASGGQGATAELSVLLQEVTWLRPLVVAQPREVHIGLEMEQDGRIGFEIYSDHEDETVVYSQGWAQLAEMGEGPWVDLEAIRGQCKQTLTAEAFYARCLQSGLAFGPSFQVLNELWVGNNVAVGALSLSGETPVGYGWVPNLLDGALQASVGLAQNKTGGALELPFAVAQVGQWSEIPIPAWAVVRSGAADSEAVRKFDVDIVAASGRVALRLSGFSTRPLQWVADDAVTAPHPVSTPLALSAQVLVGELTLTPLWEAEDETKEAWPLAQQRVALVSNPEAAQSAWLAHYPQAQRIDLTGTESVVVLSDRLRSASLLDHLVWWVPSADTSAAQLGFKLIKALLALGYGSHSLGLTVVTQQAQAVWPGEQIDATVAGVHGLIGSLAKEYAHWRIRLLDVSAYEDIPLAWLLGQPADSQGDARAYRHSQGYRQKLVSCTLPAAMGSAYRTAGVYVILGGAGGLGVALSEYLIRQYQAQVVWLGRRAEDATIVQQCARLGALGPTPLYLQADATDRQALVLAHKVIRQRFGAIHGVVHAAIVLADQSLAQMDEATFEAAWSAKMASAVNLSEVFGQETLDFLLFFSSLLSFIKPPGQSNYVAGCCFTDAFAQALRSQLHRVNYPVKVMHWGYWGSVGVVASAPYRKRMAQIGIGSIEPPEAMAVLERLLAGPVEQLIFVKTLQAAAASTLGIAVHETVTTAPAVPTVVLPQVEQIGLSQGAAQDLADFDTQLALLLRAQLAVLGWLRGEACPPAQYRDWYAHSLRLLEARGLLTHLPREIAKDGSTAVADAALWTQWQAYCAATQDKPALRCQAQLADATLRALPAVLRGEIAATEVLFPQGRLDRVEGIYRGHPVADYFNTVLSRQLIAYVQARVQADPQARLSILEIGAGTGGTSAAVFTQLAPYASQIEQYCYTDVSPAFMLHAQQHYASQAPYLYTQRLDIERDPMEQGFVLGRYDVVVAANVLHATHDIRRTLRHAKALLKGNGLLLLNELTDMGLFAHLTFGLLDGWWLAEDRALRITGTPGLAPSMWQQVLAAEGFKAISFPAEAGHGLGQQIVAAFSNGMVYQQRPVEPQISPVNSVVAPAQALTARVQQPSPSNIQAPKANDRQLASHVRRCICESLAQTLKLNAEKLIQDRALAEYGVDSITGVALVNTINMQLGLTLPTTVLFDYSTIEQLSSHIIYAHQEHLKAASVSIMENQSAPAVKLAREGCLTGRTHHSRDQHPALAVSGAHERFRARKAQSAARVEPPIAVIGMSGRFARTDNLQALWVALAKGEDLTEEVSRWDLLGHYSSAASTSYCRHGGFLRDIDCFDPSFFNISGLEATYMDPQQRLFLEEAWRALEDAGYAGAGIAGQRCGVYVGCSAGDYQNLVDATAPAQAFWGNASAMIPARIAYYLNLQGPAVATDTACSSSLVALHQACQSLRAGEIELALAGGVFVQSTEGFYVLANRAGMLSPSGHCYTFDARADGFVPSEGVGVVILKRLSQAQADGDHIYAVILGSGINQDGATNGITAPSALSQERLEREVYQRFEIDPSTIQLVEAHGTGTVLGDPIEFRALTQAFNQGEPRQHACALGSIKSNLGHAVTAAGIAGVLKVLLALRHRQIPPSLHFVQGNPHIDFEHSPFYVNTELKAWPTVVGTERRAAVSSFGLSGTNAHVVIGEAPAPAAPVHSRPAYLLVLSARTPEQLRRQAEQLIAHCQREVVEMAAMSYTLWLGRRHCEHRLGCVAQTSTQAMERLQQWLTQGRATGVVADHVKVVRGEQPALVRLGKQCLEEYNNTSVVEEAEESLAVIADLYCQGYELPWAQLFDQTKPQRISLPTYPFAKERYWVQQRVVQGGPERQLHPLVHRNTSDLSEQRFSTTLTGEEFFLRDHMVQGERVVPGAVQLEWARAAVALASYGEVGQAVMLEEVMWLRPLVVAQPQDVHIALEAQEDGRISFEMYSGSGDEVMVYSQGWAQLAEVGEAPRVDLEALQGQCEQRVTSEACYAQFAQQGLDFGPSFQVLNELRIGHHVAVGALRLVGKTPAGYTWVPNLLDGALQASVGLAQGIAGTTVALLFAVAQVRQWSEIPMSAWAVVRPGVGDSTAIRKLDVDIVDASGRVALRLSGCSTRPLHEAVDYAATAPHTMPTPPALPAPVLGGELTLAPVWETTKETEEVWPLPQQRVALVANLKATDSTWLRYYPQAQRIDLTGAESVAELIDHLRSDAPVDHLVWWVPPANTSAAQLGFKLIKALLSLDYGSRSLGLTIVTQQALAVWPGEAIDATAVGVHGLVGLLAKEYAHWRVRLLDVPAYEDTPLAWLLGQPADSQGDARAYRHGQGYRQRLVSCTLPAAMGSAYRAGGVYVILGGAGGLGRVLSEYLIQNYQAQVVWLGRRAEDATIVQECSRLGALGPTPFYLQVDATDRTALALAHKVIRQRFGVIHGVAHAAIILADQSLAQMDEVAFEAVWSAKLASTANLSEVFGQEALDFLLLFSSLLSLIKPPGQSNDVAGCYSDAFVQALRSQFYRANYPVKVMHWGDWGSVEESTLAPYCEQMAQIGIGSIEAHEAMAVLEQLLAGPVNQLGFVKMTPAAVASTLGVGVHEAVTAAPVAPAMVLPQVVPVTQPVGAAQDIADLEALLAPLLRRQLVAMGWLTADACPPEQYLQWHAHSRHLLQAHGLLAQTSGTEDSAQWWAQWEAYRVAVQDKPAQRVRVELVNATLRALPAVLRGELAATEVLFPQGQLDRVEGVYRNHPVADYFNAVLAERLIAYVQARLQADPQATLRILEIGAGTGGTSAALFAQLAPYASRIAQYCYTDMSRAFLLHAQQHYALQAPYLHTQRLDIERDPMAQDFALGDYDVVVAANVLHATRDIRRTVRHAKALLKGNGLLLLNELTDTGLFVHLTFGLLDGWWLAEDRALRIEGTPGLTPPMWQQVLSAEGFEAITFPAEAAHGLGQQIAAAFSNGVVRQLRQIELPIIPLNLAVAPVQAMVRAPSASARHLPAERAVPNPNLSAAAELQSQIEHALTGMISAYLKMAREELERDAPLSQFGFDSITLAGLGNALNQKYSLALSPTIFFEYSTIAALAGYLAREHQAVLAPAFAAAVTAQSHPDGAAVVPPLPLIILRRGRGRVAAAMLRGDVSGREMVKNEPIAVIGISGCFPQAEDIDALWVNLLAERDSIGVLPGSRWHRGLAPSVLHAGVIESVDEFDPLFFGISPSEAQAMDPQQRLLMLYVYRVLEDAGYSVRSLSGSATALLVGTTAGSGYGNLLSQAGEAVTGYSAGGLSGAMGPNRMSYWLNWHGPSEPIDTACSSSLVAVHRALELLRSGQCTQAVAGGVNTLLSMEMHESYAQAGMLSKHGRCKTFSAQADGYVRGEGVGMVFLKPLAAAERDGDHIYGLLKGSATNHGGRANSLTAPNPRAQTDLIKAALQQAGVEPQTVGYIEAHGTGTPLGDPIEIQGLKSAFAELAASLPVAYCGLGTVKSNIGHLEMAAGVVGLIKVLLQLQHQILIKSLHCEEVNPLLGLDGSPFYIVQQTRAWEALRDRQGRVLPRRAGVSSFGAGGSNAHVIAEEYVRPQRTPTVGSGPVVVVLSAKSEERLQQQAQQLLAYLKRHAEVNLVDLAYTLQVGREALGVRLALVVKSVDALQERLSHYVRGEGAQEGIYQGEFKRSQETLAMFQADEDLQKAIESWVVKGKLSKLAQLWVQGLEVAWEKLYGEAGPRRISLPTYPFAKERYWVPQTIVQGGVEHQLQPPIHQPNLSPQRFTTTLTSDLDEARPAKLNGVTANELQLQIANELQLQIEVVLTDLVSAQLKIAREELGRDMSLSEFGFDSIMLTRFSSALNQKYNLSLSTAVFLKYSTIAKLAGYLVREHQAVLTTAFEVTTAIHASSTVPPPISQHQERGVRVSTPANNTTEFEPIAVIGMSGYFPQASNLQEYWDNLIAGRDCITEIPADRWSLDGFYIEDKQMALAQGCSYNKWGGFIWELSTVFNTEFFLTAFETRSNCTDWTDEQRLFVQMVWTLLESAGYTSAELNKVCQSRVGVYAGMMNPQVELTKSNLVKMLATHTMGGLSGMVSHLFKLYGPSIVVDTYSASSMTAVHMACTSLAHGECEVAIAGGIMLMYPELYQYSCQLDILGSHLGSRSFAADSDGPLYCDGAGAVLLKRLSKAVQDKDTILGVIKSTVANNVGNIGVSNMPAPDVISNSIKQNIVRSGIDPRTISYIETFAPGFAIADALEMFATEQAFREFTQDKQFCVLGSLKPSIGHAAAASGILQLIKVLLQMQHRQLAPTLQVGPLRSDLEFEHSPFYLQQEAQTWDRPHFYVNGVEQEVPRRAMINSMGYGDFYAGVILEEYCLEENLELRESQQIECATTEQLIVLSAKTAVHLKVMIEQLGQFVQTQAQFSLQDMAYTLQSGREAMPLRWAAVVQDRESLLSALTFASQQKKLKSSATQGRTIFAGTINQSAKGLGARQAETQMLQQYFLEKNLAQIAACWVKGASIASWDLLYEEHSPRRIPLPTYPFSISSGLIPHRLQREVDCVDERIHPQESQCDGIVVPLGFSGEV